MTELDVLIEISAKLDVVISLGEQAIFIMYTGVIGIIVLDGLVTWANWQQIARNTQFQ